MAKHHDYVPAQNAKKSTWAATLKTAIVTDGPTVGLSPADVTEVTNAATDIVNGVNEIDAAITAKEAAVDAATAKINNAVKKIRAQIKRAKTHSAYTNAIGQHLGVVGDEQTIDVAATKPDLKLSKDPSGTRIDFNLQDYFDAVHIYRKGDTDLDFVYLATDTSSPYIDTTPGLKGTVNYRSVYVLNDKEVGQVSAISSL